MLLFDDSVGWMSLLAAFNEWTKTKMTWKKIITKLAMADGDDKGNKCLFREKINDHEGQQDGEMKGNNGKNM